MTQDETVQKRKRFSICFHLNVQYYMGMLNAIDALLLRETLVRTARRARRGSRARRILRARARSLRALTRGISRLYS